MSVRNFAKRSLRKIGSRLPGAREKELFFIYTTPRTGSYFMVDCLNRTEGVRIAGEALNPDASIGIAYGASKDQCRSHLEEVVYSQSADIAGAKIMLTQMNLHVLKLRELLAWFPKARGTLLFREDLFAQYLSIQKAKVMGSWKTQANREIQEQQIELDPDQYLKWCRYTLGLYDSAVQDADFSRIDVISYEVFCHDPAAALRSLIPDRSIKDQEGLVVRVPDPNRVSKKVENFGEMMESCGDARWLT